MYYLRTSTWTDIQVKKELPKIMDFDVFRNRNTQKYYRFGNFCVIFISLKFSFTNYLRVLEFVSEY